MADKPDGALIAFWRTLIKIDHSKINTWIALRNAVAVALPLGVGIALHNPLGGVAVTTGALNVAYSDGTDPYKSRARRMVVWTLLGAFAVFMGSVTGSISWLAVLVAMAWAFLAGLSVSISSKTGDLGLNTLVAVIVFAARGAMNLEGAAKAGALVIAGGLLQMLFALVFWPIRRDSPERRVLGSVYVELSKELDPSTHDILDRQLRNPSQQVQDTIQALGNDHSIEGERFRLLFDQADRLRMSTFVLQRLRTELTHQKGDRPQAYAAMSASVDQLLELSAKLILCVGNCLSVSNCASQMMELAAQLDELLEAGLAITHRMPETPLASEVAGAMDVLAGQLRVVISLAGHTTEEGAEQLAKEESSLPTRARLSDRIEILRANLDPRSTYFRHAIRLAVCVALGDGIGRLVWWERTYWLPMTIAVVLKPDFATTFSRGVLRLAGTFTGLLLATLLYHLLPVSSPPELAFSQLILVGLFTFALRSIGPANYGVFSVAISGLIVFLVAATGVPPKDVVLQRALNTAAGGVFALIAYAVWPTWERTQIGEVMAVMLDSAREYFREISARLGHLAALDAGDLDQTRNAWRRARSNAEASVDRLRTEPGTKPEQISILTSMLASSHALVHAMTGLEASILQKPRQTTQDAFRTFAEDVEFTLYFLAAALRGSRAATDTLPKLREDHRRIVEARDRFSPNDAFLVMETDRLVVSLNTLREQVVRYIQVPS
jgi:uncharacterized membrane protein YccC